MALRPRIVARLVNLPFGELTTEQKRMALYAFTLCDVSSLDAQLKRRLAEKLEPLYPQRSSILNRRLSQLLVELQVPSVVPRTLARLANSQDQVDQLHSLYVLRNVQHGWTLELRRSYFVALNRTQHYLGGHGMPGFLQNIRSDAIAGLNDEERQACKPLLAGGSDPDDDETTPRPFVKQWKFEELAGSLDEIGSGRRFQQGQQMYKAALCARCHRLGNVGTSLGPDLTSVASRFSRTNLLESILFPSRVIAENYRSQRLVTTEGKILEGRVVYAGDYRSPTLMVATNPLAPTQVTEVEKSQIESHWPSPVSFMPQGLLDTLQKDEILDLLAYIEAGGDPNHPSFR